MSLAEAVALSPGVVEGVTSAGPILQVAASVGVDMPITGAVVEVVEGRATIEDMGRMLLSARKRWTGGRSSWSRGHPLGRGATLAVVLDL